MADQISAALHLIRGEIWFERFLENASMRGMPLLIYVSGEGRLGGVVCAEAGLRWFSILRDGGDAQSSRHENWDALCEMVQRGRAFPTTALIYVLFHLAAGVPHFGDAYGMNEQLYAMSGLSGRPMFELTEDGTNSIPVCSVSLPLGITYAEQRNVTIDLLWFGREEYRDLVRTVAQGGNPIGKFVLGCDFPHMS